MSVQHLGESFGEALQQVQAIRDLERVADALPGSVGINSGMLPSDHPDAGMGLSPSGHDLGLTTGQAGE
jgi:hypothetical protein